MSISSDSSLSGLIVSWEYIDLSYEKKGKEIAVLVGGSWVYEESMIAISLSDMWSK